MTRLLQQAFEAVQALPDSEQDAIAARILEEIEEERRWDELLVRSLPMLDSMVEEAQLEIDQGLTRAVEPRER